MVVVLWCTDIVTLTVTNTVREKPRLRGVVLIKIGSGHHQSYVYGLGDSFFTAGVGKLIVNIAQAVTDKFNQYGGSFFGKLVSGGKGNH